MAGLGHTVWYRDNRVMHVRPRGIAYAVYEKIELDLSQLRRGGRRRNN